jgi:hypothetical protein
MPDWVKIGDSILNVNNIEFIEQVYRDGDVPYSLTIHMSSGKVIEITDNIGLSLWKYLDSERLKFLTLEAPERDFSGT